jgi:hypothetical protein
MKKGILLFIALFISAMITFAADMKVIVEAENFKKESGGTLKKAEGRAESSGNACIFGWDDAGHVVEWEVNIPETGNYKIVFRYSNGRAWNTFREMKIDGKIPNPVFAKVVLVSTGGFTKDVNYWKNLVVSNDKNEPILINLTKGVHSFTLFNLGGENGQNGSANFDSIGFLSKDIDANVLGKPGEITAK